MKPTLRAPGFGRWLKARRGKKSLEAVASRVRTRLARLGVKFNRSQLLKIEEQGLVPHAVVLYELARAHGVSAGDVIDRIANELGLTAQNPRLPEQPPPSDEALHLARWFDDQAEDRRRAIFSTLNVPEARPPRRASPPR